MTLETELEKEREKAETSLEKQEREAREEVARETESARRQLQRRRGTLLVQTQRAKSQVRQAERLEQRKADLPLTQPRDIGASKALEDIKSQAQSIEADIKALEDKVKTAEASALADIERQVKEKRAELDTLYQQGLTEIREWKSRHIQVKDDWITKEEWDRLDQKSQGKLKELGIEGFKQWVNQENARIKAENKRIEREWEANHVKVGKGDKESYVTKEEWDSLSPEHQKLLKGLGVEHFNKHMRFLNISARLLEAKFKAGHIEVKDGWISKTDWNELPDRVKDILKTDGFAGLEKVWHKDLSPKQEFNSLKGLGYINPEASFVAGEYDKEGELVKGSVEAGKWSYSLPLSAYKYPETLPEGFEWAKYGELRDVKGELTTEVGPQGRSPIPKPPGVKEDYYVRPKITGGDYLVMGVEMIVPSLYLQRHWNELSIAEKVLYIALDALFVGAILSKPLGAVARGAKGISTVHLGRVTPKTVAGALDRLNLALKSGNLRNIKSAALEVRNVGTKMKLKGIPGGEELIDLGKGMQKASKDLPKMAKSSPVSYKGFVEEMRLNLLRFNSSFLQANKTIELAQKAGLARRALDRELKVFRSAKGEVARIQSSTIQGLIDKSMKADREFLDALSGLIKATPQQLNKITKLANWPELKGMIKEIGAIDKELQKAWKAVKEAEANYYIQFNLYQKLLKTPKLLRTAEESRKIGALEKLLGMGEWGGKVYTGAHPYIQRLTKVRLLEDKLATALDKFTTIAKPRWKQNVASEFKGFQIDWVKPQSGGKVADSTTDTVDKYLKTHRSLQETQIPFWKKPVKKVATATKPTETPVLKGVKAEPKGKETLRVKAVYEKPKVGAKAKPRPPKVEGKPKFGMKPKVATHSPARIIEAAIVSYMGKTIFELSPENANKILHAVIPEINTKEMAAVRNAVRAITEAALKEATLTGALIKVEDLIRTELEPKTELQPKIRTLLKTKIKTAIRAEFRARVRIRPIKPTIITPPKSILTPGGRKLTEEELKASVAWKQGFIYKLLYPPYGQKNIINTREPIPGVKYHAGPQSAARSLVQLYKGELPPRILRDMGIMDVEITRGYTTLGGTRVKPKIKFRQDKKQITDTTPRVGGVR